jgi:hypothetical protein
MSTACGPWAGQPAAEELAPALRAACAEFESAFTKTLNCVGLRRITFHELRRTFGT